jgi:hypothetical protein
MHRICEPSLAALRSKPEGQSHCRPPEGLSVQTALRSQTPRLCSSSHETEPLSKVWFTPGSNLELTITVAGFRTNGLIVQLVQLLAMNDNVTSGIRTITLANPLE